MSVPFQFNSVPGGTTIPLANLDANFNYITNGNPQFSSLTLTGNLVVGGDTTLTGPVTTNNITINGSLTIDGVTVNPTGVTGSGLLVLNTGPTLVAPILGTPASGNLSNCTGYPIAQIAGLATGVLPFLTAPSSATLATACTDETGTGQLVFNTNPSLSSPTLITPLLGTPTSGNLTNCTGYIGSNLTGVVAVTNGGTGLSTTGAVGNVVTVTAPGVLGYASAPPASGLAGGAASQIVYQSAPNTTSFIPNGTTGQVLLSAGAAVPTWGLVDLTVSITNILPYANGGTNANTQQGAMNNLAGGVTLGSYLRGNGTNVVLSTIQAVDVPILNQNTTGSAATFTSTTQNSQFNSIGVGVAPNGVSGSIIANAGVKSPVLQSNAALTPTAFQDSSGVEVGRLCRAWVYFQFTGTIFNQFNVSSVTRNGVGDYTVNFTNALPTANYVFASGNNQNAPAQGIIFPVRNADNALQTTTAFRMYTLGANNAVVDSQNNYISFFC